MIRRLTAAVATGAVALAGLSAFGAAPASAEPVPLFKLQYSDSLFVVVGEGDDIDIQDITYAQWAELGFPAYTVLSTRYYKSSFTPRIYAVTDFPGTAFDQFPDGLDYAEWASAGFPAPLDGDRTVVQYVQHSTGPELFAETLEDFPVKLSFAQWSSVGFPAPQPSGYGFHKLSWNDNIVARTDDGESSDVLTADDWAAWGFPTPLVSPRLPGDRFYFANRDTDVITYQGPSFSGPLTLAQWIAAGQPAPEAYEPATAVVIDTAAGVPSSLLPVLSGTGEPSAQITLTVGTGADAEEVGSVEVDEDGAWSTPVDLTGLYGEDVVVTATQAFAGKDDEVDTLALDLDLGQVIATPADGAEVSRTELEVSGTGRPGAVVQLLVGASAQDAAAGDLGLTAVAADGTWSTTVDVGDVAATSSVLIARFTGEGGELASDSVAVELPAVPADAVDMVLIDGGGLARSLTPTITGTGEPGATVVLTADGTGDPVAVGSGVVTDGGTWSIVADLQAYYGQSIGLEASQAIPASGTTRDGVIGLDLALGLTITSPADGAALPSRTFTMTGTGVPGSAVTLTWGNHPNDEQPDLIGSPVVSANGTWTADVVVDPAAPVSSWLNATSDGAPRAQVAVQLPAAQTYAITSPVEGATGVARGTVVVTGTGVPNTYAHIHVAGADGIERIGLGGLVQPDGTWSISYNSDVIPGDVQRVLLYDDASHTPNGQVRTFTVAPPA